MQSCQDKKETNTAEFSERMRKYVFRGISSVSATNLEEVNQKLQKRLCQERFCWIIFAIIMLDILFFPQVHCWAVPLAIVTLEVGLIVAIGKVLDVDDIQRVLHRIIDSWGKR